MMPALAIFRAIIDPRGRADRFGFFLTLSVGALFAQALLLFAPHLGQGGTILYALAAWFVVVPCQRRLHDLNLSGWLAWAVLPLLFIWSVVASLLIGAAALAIGGDTLAMLHDGGPLHIALIVAIAIPLIVVGGWLSVAAGEARSNAFGPVPIRYGLSGPHERLAPVKPAAAA